MKNKFQKMFIASLVSSILFLLLGLFLVLMPDTTLSLISYLLGSIILIIGIINLIHYFKSNEQAFKIELVLGIICIVIGLFIILNPKFIVSIIPLIIGIYIVTTSIVKLEYALSLKKHNSDSYLVSLILTIITLICGIILIFNPFKGAVVITRIVGFFILVYSIIDIVESVTLKKAIKNIDVI